MLSSAAVRGREQPGESALPATPGSARHAASCSVAPGLSPPATPTQPSTGLSALASMSLAGRGSAVCMCQGVSFGGTAPQHKGPPSASLVRWQAGHRPVPKRPPSPQTLALPVVPADPVVSRAPWGSASSPVQDRHHGLPSFSQGRDRACWFPCRRNRLVLDAVPCCAVASNRAGQRWRGLAQPVEPQAQGAGTAGVSSVCCMALLPSPDHCTVRGPGRALTLLLSPKGRFFRLPSSRDRHGWCQSCLYSPAWLFPCPQSEAALTCLANRPCRSLLAPSPG